MTKTSGHRNNSGRRKISFVLVLGATFQVHHWEGIAAGQLCLWRQGHVAVAVPMAAAGKAGSDQSLSWATDFKGVPPSSGDLLPPASHPRWCRQLETKCSGWKPVENILDLKRHSHTLNLCSTESE